MAEWKQPILKNLSSTEWIYNSYTQGGWHELPCISDGNLSTYWEFRAGSPDFYFNTHSHINVKNLTFDFTFHNYAEDINVSKMKFEVYGSNEYILANQPELYGYVLLHSLEMENTDKRKNITLNISHEEYYQYIYIRITNNSNSKYSPTIRLYELTVDADELWHIKDDIPYLPSSMPLLSKITEYPNTLWRQINGDLPYKTSFPEISEITDAPNSMWFIENDLPYKKSFPPLYPPKKAFVPKKYKNYEIKLFDYRHDVVIRKEVEK